jgi:hypothetical protein
VRGVITSVILAAALLGGCKNDPCSGVSGVCIGVRVEGNVPGLDQLSFGLGGATMARPETPRALSLPVLVGIVPPAALQDDAMHTLTVEGLVGGQPMAEAQRDLQIPRAGHTSVTVQLGALVDGGPGDGAEPLDGCVPRSCGGSDVGPTDVGCGMTADCGPPSIFALSPSVAGTGQVIAIEGRFGAATAATVHFPGTNAAADSVTPTRLLVTVPFQATAGDLTVSVGTQATGPLFFRRVSFATGPMQFRRAYEQTTYARTMPTLRSPRRGAAVAVTDGFVWLFGGTDGGGAASSVERAMINADGTLGELVTQTNTLLAARSGARAVLIGARIYLIGGGNGTSGVTSVEYATVQADHTISAFVDAGTSLLGGHAAAVVEVIGRYLYVFAGGADPTIERAPIAGDGTLGAFESAGAMPATLNGAQGVVSGNNLYILGGVSPAGYVGTVLRAPINGDGSLGGFADAGVALVHPRNFFRAIALGDKILVLGGADMSGPLASVEVSTVAADGSLGAFSDSGKQLNVARESLMATIVGNSIHVIGGHATTLLGTCEVAQINTSGAIGSFADVAGVKLILQQINHGAAVIGPYVYLFGGRYDDGMGHALTMRAQVHPDGTLGNFVDAGVNLDAIREYPDIAVSGDRLYVLGSATNPNSYVYATTAADGTLGAFSTTAGTSMGGGSGRYDFASAMLADRYFAFGGNSAGAVAGVLYSNLDGNRHFGNPSTYNAVTIGTPRTSHKVAILDPLAHIVSGGTNPAGTEKNLYSSAITWSSSDINAAFAVETPTLNRVRSWAGLAVVGPTLYVLGGYTGAATVTDYDSATIADDGTLGSFTQSVASTLGPNGRSNAPALVLGNYIYLFGGVSPSTQVDNVIRAPLN